MEQLDEAKAEVLRSSGTNASEAVERLLGTRAQELDEAASDARVLASVRRFFLPDGPIFQAARLLTAERHLDALINALATAPLGGEDVWRLRRQVRLLRSLHRGDMGAELETIRDLLDGLLALSGHWESAALARGAAEGIKAQAGAAALSAAGALFLQRLRSPQQRLLDLILDGLPFALGYLRDRAVAGAVATDGVQIAPHLAVLHESLWTLVEREGSADLLPFERLRALDDAVESVFSQIRKEPSRGAQVAAIAALYRLIVCVRAASARAMVVSGIDDARTALIRQVEALPRS